VKRHSGIRLITAKVMAQSSNPHILVRSLSTHLSAYATIPKTIKAMPSCQTLWLLFLATTPQVLAENLCVSNPKSDVGLTLSNC